jgi:hypothetical protein
MVVVKFKNIVGVSSVDGLITDDTRYNLKINKNKLVKWLIKHNFRFSVGIRENSLTNNIDYIEVWSDNFRAEDKWNRDDLIKVFLEKHTKKER